MSAIADLSNALQDVAIAGLPEDATTTKHAYQPLPKTGNVIRVLRFNGPFMRYRTRGATIQALPRSDSTTAKS